MKALNIFTLAVFFCCVAAVMAFGCTSAPEETGEDGVTLGEGRIEDSPDREEPAEPANGDNRIIVDESLVPRELTPEQIRIKKEIQADVEKKYREINRIAEDWASKERAWIKTKIAEADLKMAEGNLTEAEKILKSVLKKIPDHDGAGKRLLEINARRRIASGVEKNPEERIIELVKHGEKLRTEGSYRASHTLFLEAKKLLDASKDSAIAVRMRPEIEQNLKELGKLLPPEKNKDKKIIDK